MLILLTSLLACKHYDSVDEACADDVPAEKSLDDTPEAAFSLSFALRANCYRRYVRLSQAPVEFAVEYAVEQHAEYLSVNELDELLDSWGSEINGPEYYGTDVFDRLENAG